MDFITELPTSTKQNDAIMVVVDKLSKSTHFIPFKSTCKAIDITNVFMKEIFKLHGMPKEIVSDKDTKFTSNFWKSLMDGLCYPRYLGITRRSCLEAHMVLDMEYREQE